MDVVIGAAFGDEGKGLLTHYQASCYGGDAIVVRFNGGAQAGHTVVTAQGNRHIFRHVGSGALAGAATYLSRFFVANPILLLDELAALQRLGCQPKVYLDPDALVTTPYDMFINQIVEESRADKRHGSCGVGFAETIERNTEARYALKAADLDNAAYVSQTLHRIRREWLPQRLQALHVTTLPVVWQACIASDDILPFYHHQLALFREAVTVKRIEITRLQTPVIFEGAQGLLLDQARGWFPHVTRSHTGLTNVMELIKQNLPSHLNVIYVTRSYLTRHGAGPLPFELATVPYPRAVDHTNITNAYQGALRYAWFNLTLLKSFIQADLKAASALARINHQLAVTCLDQAEAEISFIEEESVKKATQDAFLQRLAREINVSELLCSYGPTADTIKRWQG